MCVCSALRGPGHRERPLAVLAASDARRRLQRALLHGGGVLPALWQSPTRDAAFLLYRPAVVAPKLVTGLRPTRHLHLQATYRKPYYHYDHSLLPQSPQTAGTPPEPPNCRYPFTPWIVSPPPPPPPPPPLNGKGSGDIARVSWLCEFSSGRNKGVGIGLGPGVAALPTTSAGGDFGDSSS